MCEVMSPGLYWAASFHLQPCEAGRACVKLCHPVFIGLRHFTYSLVKQGEHV